MMKVDQLTVALGQHRVVDSVSLSMPLGSVTAIIGPNGAGKTSLLRAMAGLILPAEGRITLNGESVMALPAQERARRIGYLAQNGAPVWAITVQELVALGRLPHRAPFLGETETDKAAIEAALAATNTHQLANRHVDTLSGGELARAKMARILAGSPQWLLADEPLANLDPLHQQEMMRLFCQAAQAGRGIITVVHQLDAAAAADRIVMMANGKIMAAGPTSETLTEDALAATFGMPFHVITAQGKIFPFPA